jgi:hypothetical protein
VTLLELALGMMILSILSIGVSSLVKAGVESQMSERDHQNLQVIGMNIVDDLRNDIRNADEVSVLNGGKTLQVILDENTGQSVSYDLVGTQFQRTSPSGTQKIYNDPTMYTNMMQVSCPSGCFVAKSINSNNFPRQILIPEIKIQKVLPSANKGTIIDQYFGGANFSIKDYSLDVASATEFQ